MIVEGERATSFAMSQLFGELKVRPPDLLMRDYGRRAFRSIERHLHRTPVGKALVLDFDGVRVMDTSFTEETVLELALRLVAGDYGDRYLLLHRPSVTVVENLEGAIARRKAKVAVLRRERGRVFVTGHIEPNLREAWDLAVQAGELTARTLADSHGLEINTASMRLHKLHVAKLLARREDIGPSGRQHIYFLPA